MWGAGFFDLQVRCTGDFGVAAHADEEFETNLAGFEDGGFDGTGIIGNKNIYQQILKTESAVVYLIRLCQV